MDKDFIKNALESVEIIVITVVPVIYATIYQVIKKIQKKKNEMDKIEKSKRIEEYNNWEHEESMFVTSRVRSMCNYYKDQGAVDLVSFYQIENGTVARSKLCNMFLTCLAEDERYGPLPKYLHKLQRIPYSQVASWVELVRCNQVVIPNINNIKNEFIKDTCIDKLVNSSLSEQIKDSNGWFLGICLFEYVGVNYNGKEEMAERAILSNFAASVNSIFINYHEARLNKLTELGLTPADIEK